MRSERYGGLLILVLYTGFFLPLLLVGTDDSRMAGVFSLDEASAAGEVWQLYENGWGEIPSFFNLGAFYLASGDIGRADLAYAEAVRRFGPVAYGALQLQAMLREQIRAEGARRLLEKHFSTIQK